MAGLLTELKSNPPDQVNSGLPGISILFQLGLLSDSAFPDLRPIRRSQHFTPTHVALFPTNACNLNCSYCHASANEGPRLTLPWTIAQNAMDLVIRNTLRLHQSTVGLTLHGGGEPSIEWNLVQSVIRYFRKQAERSKLQSVVSLATNGVMSPDRARWIAESCDSLTLSLDGLPEDHNRFRMTASGQPTYDNVIKTAKVFDSVGASYGVRMTVAHSWVERLPDAVGCTLRDLKVREIQVEPLSAKGRAGRFMLLPPEASRFVEAFRRADEVARQFQRSLKYSGARLGIVTDRFCEGVGHSFAVTPAGDVSCCYEITDRQHPSHRRYLWGRFNDETTSFDFDEETRVAQLDWAVDHQSRCADCFCKWTCAGDCPMKREPFDEHSAPYSSSRCVITRALTHDQLLRAVQDGKALGLVTSATTAEACT
jgi:uncharacterized protein